MAVTATFHGSYTTGYLQYIDLATYHTLVAAPGSTYRIATASGWEVLPGTPYGQWASGGPSSAGQFSGVPGLAQPGAFFPGSPGTAAQADAATLEAAALGAQRQQREEQERLGAEMEGDLLARAGWSADELVLRRDGWAEGDILRRRRRRHLLELRAQFR